MPKSPDVVGWWGNPLGYDFFLFEKERFLQISKAVQKAWMLKLIKLVLGLSICLQIIDAQDRKRTGDGRKFKLSPVESVKTNIPPTMDSARLGADLLIDGNLPKDGWRSTWTAWFKKILL